MTTANGNGAKESFAHIDELVRRVELLPDPFARDAALELVQAVMGLHRSAIERILETVNAGGAMEALASDQLVSSVLAMHDLHPDDLETRIGRALEKLQFHFDSRGAGITLLKADAETVRVRYTAARAGAGEAARRLIEEAIAEAAPEVANVVIEGVEEGHQNGFVPLADLVATQRA